jgi:hypothetical protein
MPVPSGFTAKTFLRLGNVRGCNKRPRPLLQSTHRGQLGLFAAALSVLPLQAAISRTAEKIFRVDKAGAHSVAVRLTGDPNATLESIEKTPGWKHFGDSILAPTVLYSISHADNARYRDPAMQALAVRIGDLLATENEKGRSPRVWTAIGTRICGSKPTGSSRRISTRPGANGGNVPCSQISRP